MKVFAITGDRSFFKIGDSPETTCWYQKSPQLVEVLNTINEGDEIDIDFDMNGDGKKTLTKINIINKAVGKTKEEITSREDRYRTITELRKDETLRSTCEAIKAMPGSFADVTALGASVCVLFDMLWEKVK